MNDNIGRQGSSKRIREPLSVAEDEMERDRRELYEFGPFRLEPAERKLLRGNELVVLMPKAFDTLVLLVRNNGHLLEKDELIRALWPNSFVEEGNLTNNISLLRKALGDDPAYIETVPKRGYRFVGAVQRLSNAKTLRLMDASPESSVEHLSPQQAVPAWWWERRFWIGSGLAILLVIAALTWNMRRRTTAASTARIESLAVLPLENISGDPAQDYLAAGVTDELITALGRIRSLRVISRTSVMQYKGAHKPMTEIAHQLNVDAIIEGTVSRSGNHVRITANLLQAVPEKHLWAQSYDSEVGDALSVQGQIAQSVAREIQVTVTQKERTLLASARPVNPEAQDLYFRGYYVLHEATEESQEKAIRYLQQAIEKDPGYAAPYAALAMAYANWVPGANSPRDRMPKAREFALKALSLDNGVTNAHYAMGQVALFYDWDWTTAEKELQEELELNPNYVDARSWLARALVTRGKTEEAVVEAKRSIDLSRTARGWDYPTWVFILARRHDLARERAQEMVDLEPNL
jgi:TolB-like protein/DNA-binding winged helix-turn-helix (wHTH) protein